MKPIYRVIDENGRIYIPKAVRESAGVNTGDVVSLQSGKNKIILAKTKIVPGEPPTVDDILEMLSAVPKSALFEATAKLMSVLNGGDRDD